MPIPAVVLKLKKLRHRFGVGSPQVTVRRHFGWQWRVAGAAVLVLASAGLGWTMAKRDGGSDLGTQNRELRERVAWADEEIGRLRAAVGTGENAARLEKSTHSQLMLRIRTLETENAGLKEELSIFQRLLHGCGKPDAEGKRR